MSNSFLKQTRMKKRVQILTVMCCTMLYRDRRCQYHCAVHCQQQIPIDTFAMAHANFPRNARERGGNKEHVELKKNVFLGQLLSIFQVF